MIDVKKLIVGFLVLAVATASSALILSAIGTSPSHMVVSDRATIPAPRDQSAIIGANAFLPQTDAGPAVTDASAKIAPVATDPNNLTQALADSFLNNFASANTNGVTADAAGNPNFVAPDTQAVVSQLSGNKALQGFKAPNWDLAVAEQKLNVTNDSSPDAIGAYVTSLTDIYSKYYVQTGLDGLVNTNTDGNIDPATLSDMAPSVASAITNTTGLATPAPFANFQKSLVKVLVYQKKALDLIGDANNDPVKTSLTYQSQDLKYSLALGDLQDQLQRVVDSNALSFDDKNGSGNQSTGAALVRALFGVKTAHALIPVTDIKLTLLTFADHKVTFAHTLWKELQVVLLQILKNTLITFIQKRALQWITGGPTPRFIQQWEIQAVNSGVAAANNALDKLAGCLQPEFQQPVLTSLKISYKVPGAGGPAACPTPPLQLALGGSTLSQFTKDFSKGGWSAYGATLVPSGNYYGDLFVQSQIAGSALTVAVNAQANKSVSGQGFAGDQRCADGSDPVNGTHFSCNDDDGNAYNPWPNKVCPAGFHPAGQAPNFGRCANGDEPSVTTPGQTTNQGLSHAIDSNIKQVVSADNIVGILVSMVNSLFNSLMQAAIGSATNAINAGLGTAGSNPGAGTQTGTIGGTVNANSPPPQPLACTPSLMQLDIVLASTTQASATFGATGGASDASGLPPVYSWVALGGNPTPPTSTSESYDPTYSVFFPGTYTFNVQVAASTGGTATCQVQIFAH